MGRAATVTQVGYEVAKLEELLAAPPLRVAVEGGGIPDRQSVEWEGARLIEVLRVESLLALLRQWPGCGWAGGVGPDDPLTVQGVDPQPPGSGS